MGGLAGYWTERLANHWTVPVAGGVAGGSGGRKGVRPMLPATSALNGLGTLWSQIANCASAFFGDWATEPSGLPPSGAIRLGQGSASTCGAALMGSAGSRISFSTLM